MQNIEGASFLAKVHLGVLNFCSIFSMDYPLYNEYPIAFGVAFKGFSKETDC